MHKIVLSTALLSSLLFAGGNIAPVVEEPVVEEVSSWNFELSPYFAMSSISGESAVVSAGITPVKLGFDDIVDALEFGVAAHFEGLHTSGWGFILDYNYVSLGGSGVIPSTPYSVSLDIKQSVFEAQGFYRQNFGNASLDYIVGIRSWNLKMDASISGLPNLRDTQNDWVDAVVGLRWITNLSENWKFYVSGDVGAGASDFTASAVGGVRYTFNDWLDLDIQYKGLWVDYETGTPNTLNYFKYDTVTYGPIVGLNFKF